MATNQSEKHFLNLAGEYGVCAELAKNEITASITYGNHKAADIWALHSNTRKAAILEIKTTRSKRIVTGFFQKYSSKESEHPDYWVIVSIDSNNFSRFFILSHLEMAEVQMKRNGMSKWEKVNGVDNIDLESVSKYENQWEKIKNHF
jgi:hypothetical protein